MANSILCQSILMAVGGPENVNSVAHCATRLRLTLYDPALAQAPAEIKKISGVLGVVILGNQYQIVIGPEVEALYIEFQKVGNFQFAGSVEDQSAVQQDAVLLHSVTPKSIFLHIIDFISGSFMPALPVIVAGGLLSAILVVCTTFLGLSTESGTYIVLNSIYNSAFTFLPIYVGYNTAKKLNISPMLGALLGGVLVSEGINGAEGLTFLGIPITTATYSNSILPVMFSVLFMSLIYRPLEKHIPKEIKFVLVPVITMIISVPVTLIAIGPLATWLGEGIATIMLWLNTSLGWLSVGIMGAWAPIMLFTGTGSGLYPAIFLSFAENGFEGFVMTGLLAGNMAIGGAALASALRITQKQDKSVALSTGITAVFGITEPAIYGILVPYKKPFIASIIGSAVGGLFAGVMHVVEYSFASPGILTVIAFINPDGSMENFYMALITMAIAFASAFVATLIMGLTEKS